MSHSPHLFAGYVPTTVGRLTFHGSGRAPTLGFILGVVTGRHTRRRDVSVRTVEEVVFTVPPEAGVQVDGDPVAAGTTVHVRLAPEPLLVLAPAAAPAPPAHA